MDLLKPFRKKGSDVVQKAGTGVFGSLGLPSKDKYDIFKAYIPEFLYKPPYGYPRKVNTVLLKKLAQNPYIFSVIKTLYDEITSLEYKIVVKERFSEDKQDYSEKISEIEGFFEDPNGNEQSFEEILKATIVGISEVDAGVWVKVFSQEGQFQQLFVRDGSTFLKNPDIFGYMGNRAEFVPPVYDKFLNNDLSKMEDAQSKEIMSQYDYLFRNQAAYFQYGWTAGSMPIPFGKREIVYLMSNPRPDTIYGKSPLQILQDVIETLVYGVDYHLDYFLNNNIPDGVVELLGAEEDHIKAFRDGMNNRVRFEDTLGNTRKKFFKVPIVSQPVEFKPFSFNSKDMQILEQQEWFTKLVWSCFGVTAEEMGYTQDSNKAVAQVQSKVNVRKAIRPFIKLIKYYIDSEILPEFFVGEVEPGRYSESLPDFKKVPVEFVFDNYDVDDDKKSHDLLEQEIRMGVKTPDMVAAELNIDVDKLNKSKDELFDKQVEQNEVMGVDEDSNFDKKEENDVEIVEEKSVENVIKQGEKVVKDMDSVIDTIGNGIISAIEDMPEDEFKRESGG